MPFMVNRGSRLVSARNTSFLAHRIMLFVLWYMFLGFKTPATHYSVETSQGLCFDMFGCFCGER